MKKKFGRNLDNISEIVSSTDEFFAEHDIDGVTRHTVDEQEDQCRHPEHHDGGTQQTRHG